MFAVYSSLLGGYLAMDFDSREDAVRWAENYHCRAEAPYLRVVCQ
jgi:hypothetical protein